jgi:hypothetical protein
MDELGKLWRCAGCGQVIAHVTPTAATYGVRQGADAPLLAVHFCPSCAPAIRRRLHDRQCGPLFPTEEAWTEGI